MNELIKNVVELKDGKAVTTSLKIAEVFGKDHAKVLRDIRELDVPKKFTEANFGLSEYIDSTGRKLPMFLITRDGFTLLAMGFTGKKAMQFKIAYIEAFNEMERTIKTDSNSLPSSDTLLATLYSEMERRIRAEEETRLYKENMRRIARASNLNFGEPSKITGLPKDVVVPMYIKSMKRPHKPQPQRFIQLVLPFQEIIDEYKRQYGIGLEESTREIYHDTYI